MNEVSPVQSSEFAGAEACATREFPIVVTERAVAALKRLVAKDGREGVFLRLGVKGGGCSGFEYVTRLDTERKPIDLSTTLDGVEVV